jgi:hypothetical protein
MQLHTRLLYRVLKKYTSSPVGYFEYLNGMIYPKTITLPHKSDNLLLGGRTYSVQLARIGSTSFRLLLLSSRLLKFQMANFLLFPCLAIKYMFSLLT